MSESDFYSFDEALKKLSLDEEDLKRLISAGEIRAFREGSKMRLRSEDVARVAKEIGVGGKVGEEDASEVLEVEEVLFSEAAEDEGMVTTQLSEEDTLLDEGVDEVEVAEEAAGAARAPRGAPRRAAAAVEEKPDNATLVLSLLTTVLLVYGLAFSAAMSKGQSSAVTDPVVNMLSDSQEG